MNSGRRYKGSLPLSTLLSESPIFTPAKSCVGVTPGAEELTQ
jgi:hypothetical protein